TSARNIKVREELSPHGIPVIREVGEDGTLLVPDNIEACLCLPSTFGAAGDIFVVSVPDDAMRNAGIREGDYAVVERAGKVQDGELAAVARDGRPLVRRVFAGQGLALRLAADDSEYEDVVVERDGEGTRILGPVRGLLRAF
ncbi:MAG: S24 family peptidase, partial [Planctomycetota bacterium]